MTAFEDFIIAELPRRITLFNNTNTGFTGDPNTSVLATFNNAPPGTMFFDDIGDRTTWQKQQTAATTWKVISIAGGVTSGTVTTIYVRLTGSDTTGAGTLANPFRTIPRALQRVPTVIPFGRLYKVECTGLGVESLSEPITVGPFFSALGVGFDFSGFPAFFFTRPVIIEATPTVVDTITAPEQTGTTTETVTGMITYETTKNFTLDQHKGRLVTDAVGQTGVIASNTAGPNSDIEVSHTFALTPPWDIIEPSTELSRSSNAAALELRGGTAGIVFNGLRFSNTGGIAAFIAEGWGSDGDFQLCSFDGFRWAGTIGGGQKPTFLGCAFSGAYQLQGVAPLVGNSFHDSCSIDMRAIGAQSEGASYDDNIFDSCNPFGASNINRFNIGTISLAGSIIRNGTSHGIEKQHQVAMDVIAAQIHDCASDAVNASGNGLITLNNVRSTVGGLCTGVGLRLLQKAQCRVTANTDVGGTAGEILCGGNSTRTWVNFRGSAPINTEDDLAASPSQICNLFQL